MTSAKTSHDDEHFDFNKVEKEVQSAVENDERYWRENDAKIRAVEQRVPTYDDFREMVMAAHIKPLEKDDKISSMGRFTQVWNQAADKNTKSSSNDKKSGDGAGDEEKHKGQKLPKSGQEFAQHWKRHCKSLDDKKSLLFMVGAQRLAVLFKTEISGGLLGEFFNVLLCVEDSEAASTLELLEAFTKSQRFSLSLAFLSKKEKDSCKEVFQKLKSLDSVKDSASQLKAVSNLEDLYGMKDK